MFLDERGSMMSRHTLHDLTEETSSGSSRHGEGSYLVCSKYNLQNKDQLMYVM